MVSTFKLAVFLCFFLLSISVSADDSNHKYEKGEDITVWVNRVGPYNNPQETYAYFSLPVCRASTGIPPRKKENNLAILLTGSDLTDSSMNLKFLQNMEKEILCTMKLTEKEANKMRKVIRKKYWYQFYIDELPTWGMVGEYLSPEQAAKHDPVGKERAFMYTTKQFTVKYNKNRIIEVSLTSAAPVPIKANVDIPIMYTVVWEATDITFSNRFDKYLDFDFFEHKVHWFAIFNSFVIVLFLCGVVAFILLLTLRKDVARYSSIEDDLELSISEESGWKQVHNDVFRPHANLPFLAALVGTGVQLVSMCVFCLLAIGVLGTVYDHRGRMASFVLVAYCITSIIGSAAAGAYYKRCCDVRKSSGWKVAMVYTAALLPSLCMAVQVILNLIALLYDSSTQSNVGTIAMTHLILIWLFVQCPLVLIGTVIGRTLTKQSDYKSSFTMRPIPYDNFFSSRVILVLASGVITFIAIFIEVHLIFSSLWSHKFYYVYGFMGVIFTILLVVTICMAVVSTYLLLNAENWKWGWSSFVGGSSIGMFIMLYSIYYLKYKTEMNGILQLAYYFGYVFLFSCMLSVMTGSIAHLAAMAFVHRIYNLKHD